ncbi:MAG TPA: alkaline phosphatase PhoX [Gammaproteobacteria bacterium]
MNKLFFKGLGGCMALILTPMSMAGTDVYFNPLTQSAAVASPNHVNELNSPWQTPAGISQVNLTSLREVESSVNQSILRVPGAGTSASMFDMVSYDDEARFLFIPHETPYGAGASRYDLENDTAELLFSGDLGGLNEDWSNDYGAFDPSTWTPNRTLFLGEEWTAEGRIIEVVNPLAPVEDIQIRELQSIPNVAHEGLRFGRDDKTLYFVDEWNSGSIYKIVFKDKRDYSAGGQSFVLVVDAYNGNPADNYNESSNANAPRTGLATWVPITDKDGNKLTSIDPYRNGPTNDPRSNDDTRGGRPAADEVNGTPYGRPEDMEVGELANGHEVVYVAATSENAIYSIEMLHGNKAMVRLMASETDTPKNADFPATTARLNSPDNLAQDALGNIYVVEDAPNGSNVGGDIWFVRDTDNDGVAESLDHFMSIQVDGSEATGMIFNPQEPTQFVVVVMHPDSTTVPNGFGDAIWQFDLRGVVPPPCSKKRHDHDDHGRHDFRGRREQTCTDTRDANFVELLEQSSGKEHWSHKKKKHSWRHW